MEPISHPPLFLATSSITHGASPSQSHAWSYVLYLLRSIERLADIMSYCHPFRLLDDGIDGLGCKDIDILRLAQGHDLWSTGSTDVAPGPPWPRDEIVPYICDVLHWAASTVISNRQMFARRREAAARTVKKGMGATALALRLQDNFRCRSSCAMESFVCMQHGFPCALFVSGGFGFG